MPQTITAPNYTDLNIRETLQLDSAADAGQANLKVVTNQGVGPSDFLLIGYRGAEGSELLQVQTITGTADILLSSSLQRQHLLGTPVYKLLGNQVQIYRAANVDNHVPPAEAFELLVTINIDPDQTASVYTDPDGGSDFWYKFIYWNNSSNVGTDVAAATPVRALPHYATLAQIRQEAGFRNAPYVTDELIDEKRQVAEAEVVSTIRSVYQFPLPEPINPNIMQTTIQIAAGLLMGAQYGSMNPSLSKEGDAKVAEGRATLSLIATKVLVLDDVNFNDASIPDGPNSPDFYPLTGQGVQPIGALGPNVGDGRMFHIGDRY